MAEQGFASDKATWADATEEEQKKMEQSLWLPDDLLQPIVEKMPALSAARRSSVSAKGMAQAILSECASCNTKGFYSSQ
eukprot:1170947-Karenia_brevis.AAC.1